MPTNILRNRADKITTRDAKRPARVDGVRRVVIKAGRVAVRAELLDTATADRIWAALPLHSTAETWGQSINFEVPIESGRERGARVNAAAGEIYYASEDDRVIIAFGPTPISRGTEIRLPRPCNVWAKTEDDVSLLKCVTPGEKVSMTAA